MECTEDGLRDIPPWADQEHPGDICSACQRTSWNHGRNRQIHFWRGAKAYYDSLHENLYLHCIYFLLNMYHIWTIIFNHYVSLLKWGLHMKYIWYRCDTISHMTTHQLWDSFDISLYISQIFEHIYITCNVYIYHT